LTSTLVVVVHPNPQSFTASWAHASIKAAREMGPVMISDLYAQGFDPAERPDHYGRAALSFDPLKAQEAAGDDQLPEDVAEEIEKLSRADQIIFHVPMWWFAPPAMLKGWFDRVLVHGALHDVENRFDKGRLRGKRALFCVNTGASEPESGPSGREGDARLLLWPAAMTLHYLGITVLEPMIVSGVHGYYEEAEKVALEQRLAAVLEDQCDVVAGMATRPALPFNADSDFDADGRLKPDAPEFWPFTRHDP